MKEKNNFHSIHFEKVKQQHLKTLFQWLSEPHMNDKIISLHCATANRLQNQRDEVLS
jgi:hypothetical protein